MLHGRLLGWRSVAVVATWPMNCPECGAGVVWGGTPDADYDCRHYTKWTGMRAPWWINLPGPIQRMLRRRELRKWASTTTS